MAMVRVRPCKPAFAAGVIDLSPVAQRADGRGHDDLAVALLHHVFLCFTGAEKTAFEVDGDHGIPLVVAHSEEQVVPQDPRVVDQDVQAPEVLDDLGDRACDLIGPRDVAAHRDGVRPDVLHPLDRVPAAVLGQVQHRDPGPGLGQAYRLRRADPASRAGDQGHALLQCHHNRVPPRTVL
jgi:hypothetical protein